MISGGTGPPVDRNRVKCSTSRRAAIRATLRLGGYALLAKYGSALANEPKELFFYPYPNRIRSTSEIVFAPIVSRKEQATEDFPNLRSMKGLIAMVYWSKLNPALSSFDFGLFEQILKFWSIRGKSIVLGAVTVGYPILEEVGDCASLTPATPDWVLKRSKTYEKVVGVLGPVRQIKKWPTETAIEIPVYWDDFYLLALQDLVRAMSKFDGHPNVSRVRISLGITGEDNPTFDGLPSRMPEFTNQNWLRYCKTVTQLYLDAFARTQLEFDIDRVGWIVSIGTAEDRLVALEFLGYLQQNQIFLAMNGFDPINAAGWLSSTPSGPTSSLQAIDVARRKGGSVGLETGLLAEYSMDDLQILSRAIRRINPTRLVLLADAAAALDMSENGVDRHSKILTEIFSDEKIRNTAAKTRYLLQRWLT